MTEKKDNNKTSNEETEVTEVTEVTEKTEVTEISEEITEKTNLKDFVQTKNFYANIDIIDAKEKYKKPNGNHEKKRTLKLEKFKNIKIPTINKTILTEKLKFLKKYKKITFSIIAGVFLFFTIILSKNLFQNSPQKQSQKQIITKVHQTKRSDFKITPLKFKHWKKRGFVETQAGKTHYLSFFVSSLSTKTLPIHVNINLKIYEKRGKLIHNIPNFLEINESIAPNKNKLEVKTSLRILKNTPKGLYRIVFEAVDKENKRKKIIQKNFKVI